MPKRLTKDKVVKILQNGDFEELVGTVEDDWLECKAGPYQLGEEHQKQELAKDVSGLANAGGGLILIGVKTEKDAAHSGDEIREIRPFEQQRIDPEQYHNVLNSWVYPTLREVRVEWMPSSGNRVRGITAISIPSRVSEGRPFLVTKTVDEKGKLLGNVFGYFERSRSSTQPYTVERLQALLKDGLRFDTLAGRYDDLNESVQNLHAGLDQISQSLETQPRQSTGRSTATAAPSPRREDMLSVLQRRTERALIAADLEGKPSYALGAIPTSSVEIPSLVESRHSDVVRLLEHPPELRESGFDLHTGQPAGLTDGGRLRRAMIPGWKSLELWRDGALIFVASGGIDFLCWNINYKEGSALAVRPIVLAESTYLFCKLAQAVYSYTEPRPTELQCTLELRNLSVNGHLPTLTPIPDRVVPAIGTPFPAPHSGERLEKRLNLDLDPEATAFQLVQEVYVWFGIEADRIPYTLEKNGVRMIDTKSI